MVKVTYELLFKYFNRVATDEEKTLLSDWISESDENRQMYDHAGDLYEEYLLTAPLDLIEGHPKTPESTIRRRRIIRRISIAIAGVAATVAMFFCSFLIIENRYENRLAETYTTIEVPAGQRMNVTLEDGTSIKLNSGTKLQYPKQFAQNSRNVILDGEAYFEVTHKDKQPFVVKTFITDIQVLGTEFNVKADKDKKKFSATLINGSIQLKSSKYSELDAIMTPGETVQYNGNTITHDHSSAASKIRWTEGILDINTNDFCELMTQLENAFGIKIVIERESIPQLKYSRGELRISDGIDSIMRVVQNMADFTYYKDRKTGVIHIR